MSRLAALAGASLILTGCAHLDAVDDGLDYGERQRRLAAIADWELRGDLVIDTGERRERARVAWEQQGEQLSLTVRPTIASVGSFRISGNATRLVIEGRGETQVLEDPEIDLYDRIGWWLPVTSLERWLLGRPDLDFPADIDRGPAGTLDALRQRAWQVRYEEYQLAAGLLVPRALTMTHERLTLRLDQISFEQQP